MRPVLSIAAAAIMALTLAPFPRARAQSAAGEAPEGREHVTWYFYTVKWGHQDEFLDLFQRNHYPILKAQLGSTIRRIRTFAPQNHGDGRADWTFAVELTFTGREGGPSDAEIAQKLYPDMARFRREERRRFEILVAHWDVPLNEVDLETRAPSEP
jgi:hypothetical protein